MLERKIIILGCRNYIIKNRMVLIKKGTFDGEMFIPLSFDATEPNSNVVTRKVGDTYLLDSSPSLMTLRCSEEQ